MSSEYTGWLRRINEYFGFAPDQGIQEIGPKAFEDEYGPAYFIRLGYARHFRGMDRFRAEANLVDDDAKRFTNILHCCRYGGYLLHYSGGVPAAASKALVTPKAKL